MGSLPTARLSIRRGGKTYRHVDGVGRQKDGTYVFQGIQFNPDGTIADPEETLWVYRNQFRLNDGGDKSSVKDPKIAAPNDTALTQWCNAVTKFFGLSGACQALFLGGFVAAGLHFDEILEIEGRFPTLNAIGAAGTKKTIAMQAAMSLFGGHDSNVVTRVTTPRLYDLAIGIAPSALATTIPIHGIQAWRKRSRLGTTGHPVR